MKHSLALLIVCAVLSGCRALGEVAYDLALDAQADKCAGMDHDAGLVCSSKVTVQRKQADKARTESAKGSLEPPNKGKGNDMCFIRAGERVCPN